MKKIISIIVAVSDNMAIGREGAMPWHLPEDLKYFKRITSGSAVIMGRRTWESIGSRPLPNRQNIIVSHTMTSSENYVVASSIEEAVNLAQSPEAFIIGGGSIYAKSLGIADKLYLTRIHTTIEDADTFFPIIDFQEWDEIYRSELFHDDKSRVDFEFLQYRRK